jgi:hypothetical protein
MIRVESDLRGARAGVAYWRAELRKALRRRNVPGPLRPVRRAWARYCVRQIRRWQNTEGE